MQKGRAFFVVGRKNWGKSDTLEALTDGSPHFRWWKIKGNDFFIRRMSDDDDPRAYEKFANDLDPESKPRVLAALCPGFVDRKQRSTLIEVFRNLKRSYELFFFVLRNKGNNPAHIITDEEIEPFDRFGLVKVYRLEGATPEQRARALETFIKQHA